MDYNDEMKRLGEHPAMKEIPEYFGEKAGVPVAAAAAAAAAPRAGGAWKGVIWGLGAAVLAAAIFLMSDTYYTQRALVDTTRSAAATLPAAPVVKTINVLEFTGEYTADAAAPAAATATAATAKAATAASASASTAAAAAEPDAVYLFPNDGSSIGSSAELDAVAREAVAENADVIVTAYTDETGSASYNERLSQRRAKAVGDYLIAHGVAPEHIRTEGCGPTHAFATNALDRRAEVRIVS